MSHEGHVQALCKNGHYNLYNAYASDVICSHCGGDISWENNVDDTNCDAVGEIPLLDFECIQEMKTKTCPTCKNTEILEPRWFQSPEGKGRFVTNGGTSMGY